MKKAFLISIIIILSTLIYEPFIFRSLFGNLTLIFLVLFFLLFLLTNIYLTKNIKSIIFIFTILFCFNLCYRYFFNSHEYFNASLFESVIIFYSTSYFLILNNTKYVYVITNIWNKITLYFAYLTIISFVCSNFNLLSFKELTVGEYPVEFNPILGMVHPGLFFKRPSLYFAEPSYLGFFLGLNSLFLISQKNIPKTSKSLVFIAALLTGAKTVWIGFIPVILLFFVNTSLRIKKSKNQHIITLVVSLILIILVYKYSDLLINFNDASYLSRQDRISNSFKILKENSTIFDFLVGHGSTYIVKTYKQGESNAFIKLLVEYGFISLISVVYFIYIFFKEKPYLMYFTFIALNAVVILITPLFFLNVAIIFYHTKTESITFTRDE